MGKRRTRYTRYTPAQVAALCGGELPKADGFAWERVEHFLLEDGVLQPYSGKQILPGPGLEVALRVLDQ